MFGHGMTRQVRIFGLFEEKLDVRNNVQMGFILRLIFFQASNNLL